MHNKNVRRWLVVALAVVGVAAGGYAGQQEAAGSGAADAAVVRTDRGPVHGTVGADYRSFQGIPYAAPPVGERRWQPPQPAARWTGTRDATKPGNACPQNEGLLGDHGSTAEDCLFVNVTVPRHAGSRPLPVMVFIHGNGFTNGQGAIYGGRRLAVGGDVVVVTVNYRLNVFGFLAHPALGTGSGNFGLLDQQAALRWVGRNAAAFGGNPHNVTVFGESAGAISTCAQLVSPGAAGLFQRAIIQSGACTMARTYLNDWGLRTRDDAQRRGEELASGQHCADPATVMACLRGKSVAELLDMPDLGYGFGPVYGDDAVLPLSPADALRTGRFNKVPVLQGTTRDEHRTFTGGLELLTGHVLTQEEYPAEVAKNFAGDADAVLARYPGDADPASVTLARVATDSSWACQALFTDQLLARHVPTYAYEFADEQAPWFADAPPPSFPTGAFHASELQYLFDGAYATGRLSTDQSALAQRMIRYWAAFARGADPNTAGQPTWPRFDQHAQVLSLAPGAQGIHPVDFGTEHHCQFWRAIGQS
jgi:para-nitrobenzyl esterase